MNASHTPRLWWIAPLAVIGLVSAASVLSSTATPDAGAARTGVASTSAGGASVLLGDSSTCDPILDLLTDFLQLISAGELLRNEIPEPGWVLVDPARRYQEATGRVVWVTDEGVFPGGSDVSHTDFPAVHDSHDQNTYLYLDPGQEGLLSDVNAPNILGVEWEIGTFPGETGGDAPERTFPRWAWPSPGDHVWVNGNWIFDCGHPTNVGGVLHYRSEIHPPRALASMRDQMALLPGSGATPVRTTEVDLYVHGRAGLAGDVLDCGAGMTFDSGACGASPYPRRGSPIDVVFDFDVCLPPKPSPAATLSVAVEDAPGNTLSPGLDYEVVEAQGACAADVPQSPLMLRVVVPLAGSGATPDDVYARRLTAGWVFPDAELAHVRLRLEQMVLHDDTEKILGVSYGDCECSFFWVNTNRARTEWYRLAGFDIPTVDEEGSVIPPCFRHTNRLTDFDDDDGCGNGNLLFSGPTFDFYLGSGMSTVVSVNGYDQDCQDLGPPLADTLFGRTPLVTHVLGVPVPTEAALLLGECYVDPGEEGNNDDFPEARGAFSPADFASAIGPLTTDDYRVFFASQTLPLTREDVADLGVTKTCAFEGEVALAGQPVQCTVTVTNAGPGLPRDVVVTDSLTGTQSLVDATTPTFTVTGPMATSPPIPCEPDTTGFSCAVGTVPVGGRATITWTVTPNAPGALADQAAVTTASTDPVPANDTAPSLVDVYLPVTVDVRPGGEPNPVPPSSLVSVAILSTPSFDARTVDPATVCFGSATLPAARDCTERHSTGHLVDADHDRDVDLVLHYEAMETGIQPGDTTACLIGRTFDGTGVYGCDAIIT